MDIGGGRNYTGPVRIRETSSHPHPVRDDLVHPSLQQFTYEDLKTFTDGFSDDNFIVRTQFCKVYRGIIPKSWIKNGKEESEQEEQVVTVKIWANSVDWPGHSEKLVHTNFSCNFERCKDEVKLLTTEDLNMHPNLVKLMGWCCEIENESLGVVYNLNSYDTLRNLIPIDTLNWADRINIALGLANLLEALHNHQPRCLVLNFSAAHIMMDQDCNPVLLEFGMLCTNVPKCPNNVFKCPSYPFAAYGYLDPRLGAIQGWCESTDVFGFGAVLMELLSKCTVDDGVKEFKVPRYFRHEDANRLYRYLRKAKGKVPSGMLVNKSLMEDAGFNHHDGDLLTLLALECLYSDWWDLPPRPTITEVISWMKCLYLLGGSKLMPVEGSMWKKIKKTLICR